MDKPQNITPKKNESSREQLHQIYRGNIAVIQNESLIDSTLVKCIGSKA